MDPTKFNNSTTNMSSNNFINFQETTEVFPMMIPEGRALIQAAAAACGATGSWFTQTQGAYGMPPTSNTLCLNADICIPHPSVMSIMNNNVELQLLCSDLWKKFRSLGHEMLISVGGQPLFPSIHLRLRGLEPAKEYRLGIEFLPLQPTEEIKFYCHPSSPMTGEKWMSSIIDFSQMQITSDTTLASTNKIPLHQMHKYRLQVLVCSDDKNYTFHLHDTEFFAVTQYTNKEIIKMKVTDNPFEWRRNLPNVEITPPQRMIPYPINTGQYQ